MLNYLVRNGAKCSKILQMRFSLFPDKMVHAITSTFLNIALKTSHNKKERGTHSKKNVGPTTGILNNS